MYRDANIANEIPSRWVSVRSASAGLVLAFAIALAACGEPGASTGEGERAEAGNGVRMPLRYARGFSVEDFGNWCRLQVLSADTAQAPLADYALLRADAPVPAGYTAERCLRLPLKRIVCTSTTQLALFIALDARERIAGLSMGRYVYDEAIRRAVETERILEVGYGGEIDYEVLMALEPDLVLTYHYGGDGTYGGFEKLSELGISALPDQEFMETTALAQAEWVKFLGVLIDERQAAESYFNRIEARYLALAARADSLEELAGDRPEVLVNMAWKGEWTVPAGESFAATLIDDAGGSYLWREEPGAGSLSLDLESVLERGRDAEVWIHPGAAQSLDEVRKMDPRVSNMNAWQRGNVYNNDARKREGGGNDFWESAVVRPDLVLEDLVRIFYGEYHPDTDSGSFTYYRQLP